MNSIPRLIVLLTASLCAAGTAGAADSWSEEKAALQKLGESRKSAAELYQSFKKSAKPPRLPDWSGLWERRVFPYLFDPDQKSHYDMPTAKLRPKHQAIVAERIRLSRDENREFDNTLSACLPPGYPRWFSEPFAREFVVTPNQTWLMNEIANETRRVYTDGREHTKKEERYPVADGDSIGFWDGDKLVVHTISPTKGMYQRLQADYTEQLEGVEIWQRKDDTIIVNLWVYDSEVLLVPWYTRQTYHLMPNTAKETRMHYYDCVGNTPPVIKKEDGSSDFGPLPFEDK